LLPAADALVAVGEVGASAEEDVVVSETEDESSVAAMAAVLVELVGRSWDWEECDCA
jgi:hypothetical protein